MSNQIIPAIRQKPKNPNHEGNPLIESLFDQLPSTEFYRHLRSISPPRREEVLEIPIEIRPQYLDELGKNFLVPNRRLYLVYELIHSSINSSYMLRNPLKNSIKSYLRKDYRDFAKQL